MKALSTSIVVVVTVIVVLVVALVVLSIFGNGIGQINTISNFRNNCITQCRITCGMGALPPTWGAMVKVQGETGETSCAAKVPDTLKDCGCTGAGGTTAATCQHSPPCDANCPLCPKYNDCRIPCQ